LFFKVTKAKILQVKTNMKYAILRIKGKQYRVSDKDEIVVDRLEGNPEAEVLLLVEDGKVKIGKPKVSGVKVDLKVINKDEKGEKIKILKYKAKSRYRRRIGFRSVNTRILVNKILS